MFQLEGVSMGLNVLLDPNIVYLLLLFGLWSAVTAAYLPGPCLAELVSAGASIGAIVLLMSMPTNWLSVLLLVVGVGGFLVMPFLSQRFALLATGGLVLQALGSLFLFNGLAVSPVLIAGTIAVALLYHRFVLVALRNNNARLPDIDDDAMLIGAVGRVVSRIAPVGTVQAGGELWTARSPTPLEAGEEVVIIERDGLVVTVESIKRKREALGEGAIQGEEN
jgi:membrane-bound serine protease (ClpP class)